MADTAFPKHKVLSWPAVPIPTPDEVYAGLTDQAKEYPLSLEVQLRQSENFKKPECLTTIRVLDLSKGMIIGNWCSSMLSELGADTIKCEPPAGDPLRWQTPFGRKEYMFKDVESGEPIGLHFLHEMRNKQSITLDLEKEEGRELLKKLVVHFDVLIENYPPGQFDKWGIGYRQLKEINPRLVYTWVGQKGQWGPSKDKPGNLDPTAQASCGFVHGTGLPKEFGGRPTRSAMWMADHLGGHGDAGRAHVSRQGIGQGPVRRSDGGRGGHPDPGLQLGLVRVRREHPAPLRQLGPRDQYLCRQPLQGRLLHGRRRARPSLVPDLADGGPDACRPGGRDPRRQVPPGRRGAASAFEAGEDLHGTRRLAEGLFPGGRHAGAARPAGRLRRRQLHRRGRRGSALQVPRARGPDRGPALREGPLRHDALPGAQGSGPPEMDRPAARIRQRRDLPEAPGAGAGKARRAQEARRDLGGKQDGS